MPPAVMVYRRQYLPLSETFIYEQLIHLQRFQPLVVSRMPLQNTDRFPFPRLYHIERKEEGIALLKNHRVRLIHARFGTGGVEMLPVKTQLRLPLITSFHGSDISKQLKTNPRYRKRLPRLFRQGEWFTAVSRHMKQKLIRAGCPKEKIEIIKSGIDLYKFPYTPQYAFHPDQVRLLTVGRLIKKKGTKYLLYALAKLRDRVPNVTLTIVGEGEEKPALQRLAVRLGIDSDLEWAGALPHEQVREAMRRCDIFVLPSVTADDGNEEGIPNVLMEAMALGRPVLATRHAGIPELVIDKQTGHLVPEKDSRALAGRLLSMIKQPEQWRMLLPAARQRVEQEHDIRKQIRKLESLYERAMHKQMR